MLTESKTKKEKRSRPETKAKQGAMERLIKQIISLPEAGALVKGTVIGRGKTAIYVNLPPFGTGVIWGREYLNASELIRAIKTGDAVTAKVIDPEGEDGYMELSLKEAREAIIWNEVKKAMENKMVFELPVKDANKGGLIINWQGLDGFLPASQLKPEHYPKVPDGDRARIMEELKNLTSKTLSVYVIDVESKDNKLIFSEKDPSVQNRQEAVEKYALGDVVIGEVAGIVDFGIFVKLEDNLEGLVHISEIAWALVENPHDYFKVGDKIKTKVIEIKDGKISLSVKALKTNPWLAAANRYQRGDRVNGVVIKYNKHGALISIEEGVAGLIHISEFSSPAELQKTLELGKTYPFVINLFEPSTQKMTLSLAK